MLKIGIGVQTDATTSATNFALMKIISSGLDYGTEVVESDAVTGKEIKGDGYVSAGVVSGDLVVEGTRKLANTMFDIAGFTGSIDGDDKIYKVPEIATYKYATLIEEYTDTKNGVYHNKYIGCIVNTIKFEVVTDSFVKITLGIIGTQKGQTITGTGPVGNEDEDVSLFGEETIATIAGVEQTAEADSITIEINNGLTTAKAIAGNHILQKGSTRDIGISINSIELDSSAYVTEVNKAIASTGMACVVTLKNKNAEAMVLTIPRATYKEVKASNLSDSGAMSKSLTAKWDSTLDTAMMINIVGTEA